MAKLLIFCFIVSLCWWKWHACAFF